MVAILVKQNILPPSLVTENSVGRRSHKQSPICVHSLSIVSYYDLDNWGFIPGTGKELSFVDRIQAGTGTHSASYTR